MAAEDYIDFENADIDFDSLFEPRGIPKGSYKGKFYQRGLDEEWIEDHHFVGFCVIVRESEKSILCRFSDDEEELDDKPSVGIRKWSKSIMRWVPRSQVADQKQSREEQDDLSLNPFSQSGDEGNLWISGWLRDRWDEEGVQL